VAQACEMPDKIKKSFLKAFAAFPQITFLWKYERPEDNIADGYPNVVTSTWLDQPGILSHPKLLAFLTHSGLNSLTQAVYAGAPMISIRKWNFCQQKSHSVTWNTNNTVKFTSCTSVFT
jgi:hypothetical protein